MQAIKTAIVVLLLTTAPTAFAQNSELYFTMEDLQSMRMTRTLVITLAFDSGAQAYHLEAIRQGGYCGYLEGTDEAGEIQAGWDYVFRYDELFVDFEITTVGTDAGRFGLGLTDFTEEERMYHDYIYRDDALRDTTAPMIQDDGDIAIIHYRGVTDEGAPIAITVRCEGLKELSQSEIEELRNF